MRTLSPSSNAALGLFTMRSLVEIPSATSTALSRSLLTVIGLQVHSVVLRHHGHLRAVLLEHQRGGRNREYLPIDRRRELDLGIGAGPEGSVLVVDREDGDRGARAHIESTGDGQEFGGEMTIGQLRHRHVGRQARLEEGPERLRHGDKEAQHTDVGHSKEIADRIGSAERCLPY